MAKQNGRRGQSGRDSTRTRWQELATRALSAIVYAPLLLALAYFGNPWLRVGLLVLGALALWEYICLVRRMGIAVHRITTGIFALSFFLWPYTLHWIGLPHRVIEALLPTFIFTTVVLCSLSALLLPRSRDRSEVFVGWAMAVAGALYIGWLLGYSVALRDYSQGLLWLILALIVTWAYDTGAYLVGRNIGKRRIFQHLSAGKTLEGTLGGAFIAVMVAALYAQFTPFPLSPIMAGLIGLGAAVVAQLGDLVESLLKRGAEVKESGRLIPGHGGVLDRIDSLLFTGPYMFYAAQVWAALELGSV